MCHARHEIVSCMGPSVLCSLLNVSCIALNESCIALNVSCMALNESCTALNLSCIALCDLRCAEKAMHTAWTSGPLYDMA